MQRFGRIYRVGRMISASLNDQSATWELVPGFDLGGDVGFSAPAPPVPAFVVGKGYSPGYVPGPTPPSFSNFAMDLAAYPTTIMMKSK